MRAQPVSRLTPTTWSGQLRESLNDFAGRSPSRFAIIVFAGLILIFTLLLSLPVSSTSHSVTPLADALFTAVSVICVTGLSTVDMATHWSGFGHVIIYLGVQIGGIGVLTLASILGMIISRRLGLRAKLMAASDSNPLRIHSGPVAEGQAVRLGEIGSLLLTVAMSAVVIEGAVAVLLFPRILAHGVPLGEAITNSFYFSAMAFTNTGFAPDAAGLTPYATDYWFLTVLAIGVFLGAIGFPVIYALAKNLRHRKRRWSVHVKMTLLMFVILIIAGAIMYYILERDNGKTFGALSPGDAAFQSFFLSVMTRSGGFSTFDIGQLHNSSLLVSDMLMFIGGGSASTAGGIKVTTLAVLFLAAFAEARGVETMDAFSRRIPHDVLRLAVSVVLWGATTVAVSTILLLNFSKQSLDHVLFDVISAFATCGLSSGLTQNLSDPGVYVLAATMFMGRVGTVTLAAALAQSQRKQLFQRPEERPIVG
ncbi:TrkH family potassium uptake protein [Leifsonia sp. Root112D2]|jgi:trk system potassium uptake protein TrkH|uniref:TrkH family potassium uptake protein n=1 Tax=Leifsonia sp. Root112D2 TaxID=1736426 RepID=UPI0006F6864B|nr:potassium transporter TrkG [Leifsonia sp. Root112D2]KQV06375.1 potassium transporter Trk [Leifsonia sp. Root112D2]